MCIVSHLKDHAMSKYKDKHNYLCLCFFEPELCVYFSTPVNNIDCDNFQLGEEKKDLEEEEEANGPRQILPYSSMFIFGQTNP